MHLNDLRAGAILHIRTLNRDYALHKLGANEYKIVGHPKYCKVETRCQVHGSTWGGSSILVDQIVVGMHLEFSVPGFPCVTTSEIEEIEEER